MPNITHAHPNILEILIMPMYFSVHAYMLVVTTMQITCSTLLLFFVLENDTTRMCIFKFLYLPVSLHVSFYIHT